MLAHTLTLSAPPPHAHATPYPDKECWQLQFGPLALRQLSEELAVVVDGTGQAVWLAERELVSLHYLLSEGCTVVLYAL